MIKNLEYIKLFEAFESKSLSSILKFVKDKDEKAKFLEALKMVCNSIGFPYSELSDDYFAYLPFGPALKLNVDDDGDGVQKCNAESKWVKGEFCDKGKVKRTWGKTIRMATCPVCKGTGVKSNKKSDLKLIKFWFNSDGKFVATTGVDGVIRKVGSTIGKKISDNLRDYNVVGEITKEEFFKLPTGAVVVADIQRSSCSGTICYVLNAMKTVGQVYLLQNKAAGSRPDRQTMRPEEADKIAQFSWSVSRHGTEIGKKISLLAPKDKSEDGGVSPYEWNVALQKGSIAIDPYGDIQSFLANAHFAIVMNFDRIKNSKFNRKGDISRLRGARKAGSKLEMTDDIIRKKNIERYLTALANRLDISEDIINCNKLMARSVGFKNALFIINSNESLKSRLDKIIESYLALMKCKDDEGRKKQAKVLEDYTNDLFKTSMRKSTAISQNLSQIKKMLGGDKKGKIALEVISQLEILSQMLYKKLIEYNIECVEDFDILIRKLTTIRNVMRTERYAMRHLGPFFDHLSNAHEAAYRDLTGCRLKDVLDGMDSVVRMIGRV